MGNQRVCVYIKDISTLLGISQRHARRLFRQIKDAYNKEPHHYVSIAEFAEYTNLPIEEIKKRLF